MGKDLENKNFLKTGKEQLLKTVSDIVSQAKEGEEIEAYATQSYETSIKAFKSTIESFEQSNSHEIAIRVINDHSLGFAWSGSLEPSEVALALKLARENSKYSSKDEFLRLPQDSHSTVIELDTFDESCLNLDSSKKIQLAIDLDRRLTDKDKRVRVVERASYLDFAHVVAIASTTGIMRTAQRTGCLLAAYVIAGADDDTHVGGSVSISRGIPGLNMLKVVNESVERATRLLGAIKPPSEELTIIFEPRVATIFMNSLSAPLSGNSVYKHRSFFENRINELIAVKELTLLDNPLDISSITASEIDAEGLVCRSNTLIEGGKLIQFLHSSESALRLGAKANGCSVRHGLASLPVGGSRSFSIKQGSLTKNDLIRSTAKGLLVQTISGLNSGVNTISGDFSVGAEGILIENGEMTNPVKEVTIAGTIQKMLHNISGIGNDLEWFSSGTSGVSLRIEGMKMSGK